jgi:hypothetical protein
LSFGLKALPNPGGGTGYGLFPGNLFFDKVFRGLLLIFLDLWASE